jgi:hypothetical protein
MAKVMDLDNVLLLAYMLTEASVVGFLLYRRVWKILPIFTIYCGWDILVNLAALRVHNLHSQDAYLAFYLTETAIDSVLQFCVLVELAWSVLRPIRASLPRRALVVIGSMILAFGAAIWPFSAVHPTDTPQQVLVLLHLLQTVSVLRVIFFLALAGCSQLLSLSWRDRELQVITGLGLYSLVSLGVAMFHTHQADPMVNQMLNQLVIGSYICSLLYWVICFSQREAERQEFTPQMQNLLLAVAGVARADREALARKSVTDGQNSRRF